MKEKITLSQEKKKYKKKVAILDVIRNIYSSWRVIKDEYIRLGNEIRKTKTHDDE